MIRIFLGLGLLAAVLVNVSFVQASPEKDKPYYPDNECYQITHFDTVEKAVDKYKELKEGPVLLPTWLPYNAKVDSVRIIGCGNNLEVAYVNDKHKLSIQVTPQVKNNEGSMVSLKDGVKAYYRENRTLYTLSLDKEGRRYHIVLYKNNSNLEKRVAIENLYKIANSLNPV